ncbi:MAG: hypothetical protein A2078_15845 [Nitrospirae bacterium GWC2_57_9]|nr:MAG: hypothetical protein A2078_15845 [Nitrospirae bacterium GWC2_57_9]
MQKHLKFSKIFLLLATLGTLFVLAETVLQLFGTSICSAEGCKLVAGSARFGDLSILLIGLGILSLLTILAVCRKYHTDPVIDKIIDFVLVVSLAAEGFFTGYQAFRLHAACIFCLVVLAFLVLLSLIRLMQGHRAVVAGFASLLAVFSLFYLVLPAGAVTSIPTQNQLVLFYSDDCKYCAEVLKEIERKQLPVDHVPVENYVVLLKSMGIEHVPTLYVNRSNEKIFLTGRDPILAYLNDRPEEPEAAIKPEAPAKKEEKRGVRKNRNDPFNLGGQEGLPFELVMPPSDDGICKSDQKCD